MPQTGNTPPSPRRANWPYVIGAMITLAIQQGWSPAEVKELAAVSLVLLALIHSAQR